MSILDPMAHGFAKAAVYNIISVTPKKLRMKGKQIFNHVYDLPNFEVA